MVKWWGELFIFSSGEVVEAELESEGNMASINPRRQLARPEEEEELEWELIDYGWKLIAWLMSFTEQKRESTY